MSIEEKIDAMLRENQVSVMEFVDLIEEDGFDSEGKGDELCLMFSEFGEKLLREVASSCEIPVAFDERKLTSSTQLTALADRIKHRSPL